MNIIFMRHGNATDNVKEIISDKEIYWSTLTEDGRKTVLESIETLPSKIDKIYISPLPRTIETAHLVSQKYKASDFIIEKRIREINNGKYSGMKNNEDLDRTRKMQIAGDYFIRFGEYGENKYDIELRLCSFLKDAYMNNFTSNTIMIISHGSITSYMKRILKIKTPHIKTGKIEEFTNVDFNPLFKHIKKLNDIKLVKIRERINQINSLNINTNLKENLIKMVKKEFNNLEFSDDYFSSFISGLNEKKLSMKKSAKFDNSIILVCFYDNFENFAKRWIEHYISIGIRNFVLVNNNSVDNSSKILNSYAKKVNISFWSIKENCNCIKICGLKQQILDFYGTNHKFLMINQDELLIYEDFLHTKFEDFIKNKKLTCIKALTLDVYTDKNRMDDLEFVDKGTYRIDDSVSYKKEFYGGPIYRVFKEKQSLQKIPYVLYTGKEIYVNDHYYYPWNINEKASFCSYLLRYKLLKDDKDKTSFYKEGISVAVGDIPFDFKW